MLFHIPDYKFICFIVISMSLLSSAFPMEPMAPSLGKRLPGEAEESWNEPAAKVQKNEHSSDVTSHKMRKEIINQLEEIGRGFLELSADFLLFIKKNPNTRDERGNTLFHYALLFANQKLIDLLIGNPSIDITIKNDEGLSLLALAVQQNNKRAVSQILSKAPRSVDILNEFMLDVYSLLEETVYVMNDVSIMKMLEDFVIRNETCKIDASLSAAIHGMDLPGYRQQSGKSLTKLATLDSKNKKLKEFFGAKEGIIEQSDRLVNIIWDYDQHYNPDFNWQEQFTLAEQNILCSAFSRGIVTLLLHTYGQMYNPFRFSNLFNFLFDIDTTLDSELKNRLKIILDYDSNDMQHIDLHQKDREKLPLELLFCLLSKAIQVKDKEFLRTSLKNNNSYLINKQDYEGDTLLHSALKSKDLEIIQLLLTHSPDLNVRNSKGETPLHIAVEFCELETIQALLACRPNVNMQNNRGKTPLHIAIEFEELETIEAILACGPDLNIQDNNGETPLHLAIDSSYLEMVQAILACGPELNVKNNKGETLLHAAVESCELEIVQAIFACKPQLDHYNWCRLLGIVFKRGRIPLVKAVLDYKQTGDTIEENGAKIALEILNYYPDTDPLSAFLYAAICLSDVELIQEILKFNPQMDLNNSKGVLLLHRAIVCSGNLEVLKIFLDKNLADINMQDSVKMCTLLHMAMTTGNIDVVKKLLEYKPNLNLQDCNGDTPLHVAFKCCQQVASIPGKFQMLNIIELLLKSSLPFDKSIKNNQGNTVVDLGQNLTELHYNPSLAALFYGSLAITES